MTFPKFLEGGCACGAVRYRVDAEPDITLKCHCVDCQRASGGPFMALVRVPAAAFRFTKGTPVLYTTGSQKWGTNTRAFCGVCGSRVANGMREGKPVMGIPVSSLDDSSWYRPQMNIFVSQAPAWEKLESDIPAHELYPPA